MQKNQLHVTVPLLQKPQDSRHQKGKERKKEELVSRLPKGSIVNQFLDKFNQSKIALKKNTFQKIQTNN